MREGGRMGRGGERRRNQSLRTQKTCLTNLTRRNFARRSPLDRSSQRVKKERGKVVSTGERGDRVRTYNFKEDRITDHRSGETVYGIQGVLEGGNLWNEFWGGLRDMRRKEVEEMMEEEEE